MAMNNNGDSIDLVDPMGNIVQSFTYELAEEGELITPAD